MLKFPKRRRGALREARSVIDQPLCYVLSPYIRLQKQPSLKRVVVIFRIAKNLNFLHIMVLKVGKRLLKFTKPQINHNKTENTISHQTTRSRIRFKIWGLFRNILLKIWFLTDNKLDSITFNLQGWPQDHTWRHLKNSEAFDHSWTNAADVAFQWWRHGT